MISYNNKFFETTHTFSVYGDVYVSPTSGDAIHEKIYTKLEDLDHAVWSIENYVMHIME